MKDDELTTLARNNAQILKELFGAELGPGRKSSPVFTKEIITKDILQHVSRLIDHSQSELLKRIVALEEKTTKQHRIILELHGKAQGVKR